MNPTNKNPTGARGISQPFGWQAGHAPQSKPAVAQLKTGVPAQTVRQPVAPPAYRPQATPNAAQPKMANAAVNQRPAGAPPVYRPEQKKIVQPKTAGAAQSHTSPKSPPVYQPQPQKGLVQRHAAAQGVIQRVACAICGGDQVPYTVGGDTYNGHLATCPSYHRSYYTVQDHANGLRTRSGSFRNLEVISAGGLDQTGLWLPPTYAYVRRHYHDNTGVGGQFEVR